MLPFLSNRNTDMSPVLECRVRVARRTQTLFAVFIVRTLVNSAAPPLDCFFLVVCEPDVENPWNVGSCRYVELVRREGGRIIEESFAKLQTALWLGWLALLQLKLQWSYRASALYKWVRMNGSVVLQLKQEGSVILNSHKEVGNAHEPHIDLVPSFPHSLQLLKRSRAFQLQFVDREWRGWLAGSLVFVEGGWKRNQDLMFWTSFSGARI